MTNQAINQYRPDEVSLPGESLEEILEERGMTQAELAERTGRPKKTINEIIQGKAAITPETALQLERVLGTPARFWLEREQQYREFLARQEDDYQLGQQIAWLDRVPWKAMMRQGWIEEHRNTVDQLREVLRFFGIAAPDLWDTTVTMFRHSPAFAKNAMAVSAWLRQGERLALAIDCAPFDVTRFREALQAARVLSRESSEVFVQRLPELCAPSGVAVVIVPELPQTQIYGAARWLTPTKALIQLSLRYQYDDQFWFWFFHEAGHLLLHGKRETHIDVEDSERSSKEDEVNRFAANILIPPATLQDYLWQRRNKPLTIAEVEQFADELDIAPGIVAGRLQHEQLLSSIHYDHLKRPFAEKLLTSLTRYKASYGRDTAMTNIQSQFEIFNSRIQLGRFHESETLREKRDVIRQKLKNNLPSVFDSQGEACPDYYFLNQGSYEMGTGIKPLNGDYDIDQGLYFLVSTTAYPDPVILKERVFEALNGHAERVELRRSCVRVFYRCEGEPIYHVDVAVYSDSSKNVDGKSRCAKGKRYSEDRFWEVSEPENLTNTIFSRFKDEQDRTQFRRIIRYWKRWKAVNFTAGGGSAPSSIGLTLLTCDHFQPIYTDRLANKHNDLATMRALVDTVLGRFTYAYDGDEQRSVERLVVKLPIEPWNDVFDRMTAKQMTTFKEKLITLRDTLLYAEDVSNSVVACEQLQLVFGGDFPVPEKKETACWGQSHRWSVG
jgi:HTH-type transcriptional regulator / antitoxin HigA